MDSRLVLGNEVHQQHYFWVILILAIIAGLLIAFYWIIGLTIIGLLGVIITILVLTKKPELLFYQYLLLFVFGGISFGSVLGIDISYTNIFLILGACVIIIRLLIGRDSVKLWVSDPRKRFVLIISLLLLLQDVISAITNGSFRFLLTRISYIIIVLIVFSTANNHNHLYSGLQLGIIPISVLSLLTILTSAGFNPFGTRWSTNYGTAPWESILPRSIGLSNLDGGMHGVFIISFLPLALFLAVEGSYLGISIFKRRLYLLSVLIGTSAIAISVFRSAWLGLLVSYVFLAWIYYRDQLVASKKVILTAILIILGVVIIFAFGKGLTEYLHTLIFDVRSSGVQYRLQQYQLVIQEMTRLSSHLLVGYGYDKFSEDFSTTLTTLQLRYNPPLFLHNHFLGYLYGAGWPSLILYLWLLVRVVLWLYQDGKSQELRTRIFSAGISAGLIGCLVTLNFTSRISNYEIIWVLIAVSAMIPLQKRLLNETVSG